MLNRVLPHFKYFKYVIRHKYYVYKGCEKLGVSRWQSIPHDYTKFLPLEWFPYVEKFYGAKAKKPTGLTADARGNKGYYHQPGKDPAFDEAWRHHLAYNPHHWQYWMHPDQEMWTLQAHSPEMGPYVLAYGNKPAAIFEEEYFSSIQVAYEASNAVLGRLKAVPMPRRYAREMCADWYGAGMAQGKPDIYAWYQENKDKIVLHPDTRQEVDHVMAAFFGPYSNYDKEKGTWI